MHLRNNELDDACTALAGILLARQNSVSRDILDTVTTRLLQDASQHADYAGQLGRDPNMVTRAVLYLVDTHAHPDLGADTAWFRPMLACLLELAAPSLALSDAGARFLLDVEELDPSRTYCAYKCRMMTMASTFGIGHAATLMGIPVKTPLRAALENNHAAGAPDQDSPHV